MANSILRASFLFIYLTFINWLLSHVRLTENSAQLTYQLEHVVTLVRQRCERPTGSQQNEKKQTFRNALQFFLLEYVPFTCHFCFCFDLSSTLISVSGTHRSHAGDLCLQIKQLLSQYNLRSGRFFFCACNPPEKKEEEEATRAMGPTSRDLLSEKFSLPTSQSDSNSGTWRFLLDILENALRNYEFIHSRFTENARKTSVFIVTLMIDTQFECALFHIKCKTKRGREYKVLAVSGNRMIYLMRIFFLC